MLPRLLNPSASRFFNRPGKKKRNESAMLDRHLFGKKPKKKPVSKNSNEVMLVFPFGADKDKIHKAAQATQLQSSAVRTPPLL